jgi:hypothetical protein
MANVYAVKSGNWSDTTVWNTGALPTAADDVRPNNFVVTIDTSSAVLSLRNNASSPAVAGGRFDINSNITISADTIQGNAVEVIRYIGSTGCSINGNIIRALLTNFNSSIILSGSGVVNISGSTVANGASLYCIGVRTNQTVNFTGSMSTTTTDTRAQTFNITSPCSINISGSMVTNGAPQLTCNTNLVTVDIKGTLSNFGESGIIATPAANSIITITGSILGPAIVSTTSHITEISGSCAAFTSPALSLTGAGTTTIIGPIHASYNIVGISLTNPSATNILTGPFYNTGNRNAVFAPNIQLISGSTPTWTFDTETFGEQRTLYTTDYPGNFPSINNVRQGITFGDTSQFTGVVAIPSTGSVLKGVPVGNTTGSASFDTQNAWATPTSSLTGSTAVGTRLKNTATVANVAAAISSKGTL